ncbi:hypothetical protein A5N71_22140 [Prescottella equi]|nr:hypothetical protein A5N71_22140 [Prescottella equi]
MADADTAVATAYASGDTATPATSPQSGVPIWRSSTSETVTSNATSAPIASGALVRRRYVRRGARSLSASSTRPVVTSALA